MSNREEWLRTVTSPRPPKSVHRHNFLFTEWTIGLGDLYDLFYVDTSLPRAVTEFTKLYDLLLPRSVDRNLSLYVWAVEGLDVTVWFKDTQPGKPATVHIEGNGHFYNVRLHIRSTTIVHAKLQCEGCADELKIRLPADFTGRLVVNTYNAGRAHIRMDDAFRQRARILDEKSLGRDRGLPERFACTLFVGEGYDETAEWKGTSVEVMGFSKLVSFRVI